MTGYGSGERGPFRVELRSLNHRYLEVFMRLPQSLLPYEIGIRERVKKQFNRGKVDVTVSVSNSSASHIVLNTERAAEIHGALSKLAKDLKIEAGVGMESLLLYRDMFMDQETTLDQAMLFDAFEEAAAGLKKMRLAEGQSLKAELEGLTASIEALNDRISARMPGVRERLREQYRAKLRDLLGDAQVDEGRIVQEASALVERGDITEEIARLRFHVKQMREMLGGGGTVGRKLDFLLQEFNREANTMGSKASDSEIVSMVVEMKAEVERAREQVQNIQ